LLTIQPADWDEDAPVMIVDETATKPADWLEDEPTMIPDPDADKPEEWDVSVAGPAQNVADDY
jgi:calnexin